MAQPVHKVLSARKATQVSLELSEPLAPPAQLVHKETRETPVLLAQLVLLVLPVPPVLMVILDQPVRLDMADSWDNLVQAVILEIPGLLEKPAQPE
jgi:hypothetical protein